MEPTEKHGIGPAMAVVVIIAAVALSGIYFYKNMVKDLVYEDTTGVVVPAGAFANKVMDDSSNDNDASDVNTDLSTSTDIEAISSDLEQELEADLDLSIIDEIDAGLLDFDDLDDLDLDF